MYGKERLLPRATIGCVACKTCGLQNRRCRHADSSSLRLAFTSAAAICILSALLLLVACSPATDPQALPAAPKRTVAVAPPDPVQVAARMQECRAKLEAGIPSGLVVNASADNGRPILWVGPAWKKSTTQVKEALARDTACFFLSGDDSKTIKFSVYEQSTDREVAVWNLSHLVEW